MNAAHVYPIDELCASLFQRLYSIGTAGLRYFNVFGAAGPPCRLWSGNPRLGGKAPAGRDLPDQWREETGEFVG